MGDTGDRNEKVREIVGRGSPEVEWVWRSKDVEDPGAAYERGAAVREL